MSRSSIISVLTAVFFTCFFTAPAIGDTRVALVIGNAAYQNADLLANSRNDADDVAASLRRLGFEVFLALDLNKSGMDEATIKFSRAARSADAAMIYYSGHAIQYGGVNYLAPIDAKLSDAADLRRLTRVDDLILDLQQARVGILVLDACRDNPLLDQLRQSNVATRAMPPERGLARAASATGTVIAYATQSGRTALDGNERNSPYTTAFLNHIEDRDEIAIVFRKISAEVFEVTKRQQMPELMLSLTGELYLNGRVDVVITSPADPCALAIDHWHSAEAIGSEAAYRDHIARFRTCAFVSLATARIEALTASKTGPAATPASIPTPDDAAWDALRDSKDRSKLQDFIRQFPASAHRKEAETRVASLTPPATAPIARTSREPQSKSTPQQGSGPSCSGAFSRCQVNCPAIGMQSDCPSFCRGLRAQCMATGCWHSRLLNRCGLTRA